MIKIFINPHSNNYSVDITDEKADKGAIMAGYARLSSEKNNPQHYWAAQDPHFVHGALGVLGRGFVSVQ